MKNDERPVQFFSDEQLAQGRLMKPAEIVEFLEGFRELAHAAKEVAGPSRLISVRVPEALLAAFKFAARTEGIPYQTLLKQLMRRHLHADKV